MNKFLDIFRDGSLLDWFLRYGIWMIISLVVGMIVWWYLRVFFRRIFGLAVRELEQHQSTEDVGSKVKNNYRWYIDVLLIIVILIPIGLLQASLIGQNLGPLVDIFTAISVNIGKWIGGTGIKIGFIILFAWVLMHIAKRYLPKLVTSIMFNNATADEHEEVQKQALTLSTVFSGLAHVLIILGATFMVLSELGVPVGPILGGFGIAGIAVGFGAQHLVRDLIAGVMIISENQYRTGDVVNVAGVAGMVEQINLRRTIIRDWDGDVHVIPNGEITVATNRTKHWSRIHLDVGVAYKEDLDHVFSVLNEIGNELANDPELGLMIIAPPQVLRLQSFDDSQITIKMMGECKPMSQWEIAGELKKRIKIRFDKEGIEIPFPHTTVYWGEDQVPLYWDKKRLDDIKTKNMARSSVSDPSKLTPELREQMLAELALATMGSEHSKQNQAYD